jgi:queuine tRNA-ribosyltransferase
MVLDECPPFGIDEAATAASMRRSMRWAARCRESFVARPGYALFGIVQGGVHSELRAESAAALTGIGFDGYAIGGLAVGEGREAMFRVLDATAALLSADRPRYLMGVGKPEDLVGAVARGIDLFDCVLPTRSGRTGQAFTRFGPVNLRNARHADDSRPLDESVPCPASRDYSRAYLHHLVRSGEILGAMLLTWHNVAYYQHLMARMREAIAAGAFAAFAAAVARDYATGDIDFV